MTIPDDTVIRNSHQATSYRRIELITRSAFLEEGMLDLLAFTGTIFVLVNRPPIK